MSKREPMPVTIKFRDGSEIEFDITKPSKQAKSAIQDWMLGMKSKRPMSALELLIAINVKPRKPDELSNPAIVAKMQLVGWIRRDAKTNLWHITDKGRAALEGK